MSNSGIERAKIAFKNPGGSDIISYKNRKHFAAQVSTARIQEIDGVQILQVEMDNVEEMPEEYNEVLEETGLVQVDKTREIFFFANEEEAEEAKEVLKNRYNTFFNSAH